MLVRGVERPLSDQEWRVLAPLARGYTMGKVAAELGVSVRTVRRRQETACVSLGVHTRIAAAAEAARRGII